MTNKSNLHIISSLGIVSGQYPLEECGGNIGGPLSQMSEAVNKIDNGSNQNNNNNTVNGMGSSVSGLSNSNEMFSNNNKVYKRNKFYILIFLCYYQKYRILMLKLYDILT